jgi:hypothetical protein
MLSWSWVTETEEIFFPILDFRQPFYKAGFVEKVKR